MITTSKNKTIYDEKIINEKNYKAKIQRHIFYCKVLIALCSFIPYFLYKGLTIGYPYIITFVLNYPSIFKWFVVIVFLLIVLFILLLIVDTFLCYYRGLDLTKEGPRLYTEEERRERKLRKRKEKKVRDKEETRIYLERLEKKNVFNRFVKAQFKRQKRLRELKDDLQRKKDLLLLELETPSIKQEIEKINQQLQNLETKLNFDDLPILERTALTIRLRKWELSKKKS